MTLFANVTRPEVKSESQLLSVRDLRIEFNSRAGWIPVVEDAAIELSAGGTHALVGESGSGKTVTALSLLGLLPQPHGRVANGEILFEGRDLTQLSESQMRPLRGREIAMIFQEPMTSLNPAFTVGDQIAESVRLHLGYSRKAAWERAVEMVDLVGIPGARRRVKEYPHSFSGGMRQRVMIAMAIACEPKLLIADEPTTALDVTVQAGILQLLRKIQEQLGMAILLVTHDLGVVADFCDQVTVMYAGEAIEVASTSELFASPAHPYTAGLLMALPQRVLPGQELQAIPGVVPRPDQMPSGCRFRLRCPYMLEGLCDGTHPELMSLGGTQSTRCIRVNNGELGELVQPLPPQIGRPAPEPAHDRVPRDSEMQR